MKKLVNVFIVLLVLLPFSIGETEEYSTDQHMYYCDKGYNHQTLSIDEFNILMKQLKSKIDACIEAFSKIKIGDANFSYKTGKFWEINLRLEKANLRTACSYLTSLTDNPDSMLCSLELYEMLRDSVEIGYGFYDIGEFKKCLNDTVSYLDNWCNAFLQAHLKALARAKDLNKELYPMKK